MEMTLFILLFSSGFLALLVALLHFRKIPALVFSALVALLVIFDFSLLSLDKIYLLHQEQDELFTGKLMAYDKSIAEQASTYEKITEIQLDMSLQLLAQNSNQDTEKTIQKKIQWRDQIIVQLQAVNFDETSVDNVKEKVNAMVHQFLMEQLNKQLRQGIGHRSYSEFIRRRPREQWTDELFIKEVTVFLEKENLMNDALKLSMLRIEEFKQSGVLIHKQ